ncbi:MAG: DegT/DnrJ/EryC1/StrS family aminotransferase [Deltaproteobacteria bacterium]|nr:DegT/DnrJ/EryC1/StrS family aminotransferase [Deltaproteobacteria bacterium]
MWKVSLCDLRLHPDDHRAVAEALTSNWLTMGPRTQAFEDAFALALDPVAPPFAFAVSNCTVALHMAYSALDIGPGDEVIVPSLTFVATANAALYTGATVVLCDVAAADDLTLSVDDVLAKITPRTRAVAPVHYAGQPADLRRLVAECQRRGIAVVEDVAHAPLCDALVADGQPRALGTIGDVGCFSFFSNKNMTTGEGGMVTTRDPHIADKLRLLRSHGMTTLTLDRHRGHAYSYDVVALGNNYRMDELRAALGASQLARLPDNNRKRTEVVACYLPLLRRIPGLEVPFADRLPQGRSSPHILPVLLPAGVDRQRVQQGMKDAGVQTSVHYPPIHTFTLYKDSDRVRADHLPVTEAVAPRLLTLPLYPDLSEAEVQLVCRSLAAVVQAADAGVSP